MAKQTKKPESPASAGDPYGVGSKPRLRPLDPPRDLDPARAARERAVLERKGAPKRRVRESWMLETHLGGRLENVPGFPTSLAMTDGFASRLLAPGRHSDTVAEAETAAREVPQEPALRPESIFMEGPPWTRIADTSRVPFRSVCHLEITYENNMKASGSAWFSGRDTLITAGHNLYSAEFRVWAKHVRVIPGRNANVGPFGETFAARIDVLPGWKAQGTPEFDLGVIKVADRDLGLATGWFGFAVFTDDDLTAGPLIQSAGYPALTKPFGTQWYDAGRASRHSAAFLGYRVDSERGQSGAPVFFSNSQGQRWVVATHVYGETSKNLGLRVTNEIFEAIEAWTAADG